MKKTMVTCRLCRVGIRIQKTVEDDTVPRERVCKDAAACLERQAERDRLDAMEALDAETRRDLNY